jgi:hypothetical protein
LPASLLAWLATCSVGNADAAADDDNARMATAAQPIINSNAITCRIEFSFSVPLRGGAVRGLR